MPTRKSLSDQCRVLEIVNVSKIRSETGLSLLCSLIPESSTCPPKQMAGDPPAKACSPGRRLAKSSVPPISQPFTRCSGANTVPQPTYSSEERSAGKKRPRPGDNCDENADPSATASVARPRKTRKRLGAPPPRKLKRLPLREELEVLREALPLVIRSQLDPPRDDKGPIPDERRTLGGFLRWKSLYNDEMVDRITDERHVVCKRCGNTIWLCHDTAYNWFKWGRHRDICMQDEDLGPVVDLQSPVLLHNELRRHTGRPEVDALFPKTKGGPYYRHSWTYFIPRPGQSRPDDPKESLAPSSSSGILSTSVSTSVSPSPFGQASVKSELGPSRHAVRSRLRSQYHPRSPRPCPWALNPKFKAEEEARWSDDSEPHGVELLLAAAKFLERTNVECAKCTFS